MIPLQSTSIAVAACACAIAAGPGRAPVRAAAQVGPDRAPAVTWRPDSLRPGDVWNTLTLDMKVERRRLMKSGQTIAVFAPVINYRVERSAASGRWKTVIRILGGDRAPAYTLSGALLPPDPFPVTRVEDDEDGSPVRVYDRAGRLILGGRAGGGPDPGNPASANPLPRSNGVGWLDSLVATSAKRSERMQAFERQFGVATASGAVSRFTRTTSGSSDEIVIDSVNVVPVETKAIAWGLLLSSRTFTYTPMPDGVVRTRMHSETLISATSGDRIMVDTTFSNIRLGWR